MGRPCEASRPTTRVHLQLSYTGRAGSQRPHKRKGLAHPRDVFRGDGRVVGRGEGEAAVGAGVKRLEVKGHFLFPLTALAEAEAVHANKPIRAWNHLHHQRELSFGQRRREREI